METSQEETRDARIDALLDDLSSTDDSAEAALKARELRLLVAGSVEVTRTTTDHVQLATRGLGEASRMLMRSLPLISWAILISVLGLFFLLIRSMEFPAFVSAPMFGQSGIESISLRVFIAICLGWNLMMNYSLRGKISEVAQKLKRAEKANDFRAVEVNGHVSVNQ